MENVELFTEAGLKVDITLRGTLVKMRQPHEQRSRWLRQNLKLDQGDTAVHRERSIWVETGVLIASWD